MSETPPAAPAPPGNPTSERAAVPSGRPSRAQLRRRRFSFVWVVPLLAAMIAAYLGYRTFLQQGPLMTVTFASGEGLTAGQTQVKYKAVALGTVESIDLSHDNKEVIVQVRMTHVGARFLNKHARFWVVRPNFSPGNISGLDTLVSGAYIAVDPGAPGGQHETSFAGLAAPPGVRSDQPGNTYRLQTGTIGALSAGTPVFYRDIVVGEVLGYDFGDGLGPITVNIFVQAPFDNLIRPESHFWKSSGVTAGLQGGGFHVEFQSLQAIISGGITFDVPRDTTTAPSPDNSQFPLFDSHEEAQSAGYQTQIPLVAYFETSVTGLTRGSAVDVLGIQVGSVTDVRLVLDPYAGTAKARVAMALQPDRVVQAGEFPKELRADQVLQKMVNQGMRAQLDTASFITGQKEITLAFVPNAGPVQLTQEGDAFVMPSQPGGLDNIMAQASQVMTSVNKIPFEKIGDNLNRLLLTANDTIGGKQVKQALASLSATLKNANTTLNGVQQSYGNDSDFERNLEQLMGEANDTLRSVKVLADYLDRHPEALLLGRGTGK